uniref:CSON004446 protein n=1 Tax=Culicoides sonorensis TaxID=179676 RepID=A0A336MNY6_CULSO
MGKSSSFVITTSVILNTLLLAASLWLVIKSAQLREHDKTVNIVLPKVMGMWAYDSFAAFGSIAMILAAFGYLAICFCRDSCMNIQIGILILYVCIAGYLLWPQLKDYDTLDRASRGEISAIAPSITKSITNLFNNARE